MKTFSVVVIGKNEEERLGDSLRAVLAAAAEVEDAEVVYVDSASTDRSVEIAHSLGVRVLALRPEWLHTPAAGRLIGYHHTTGEYLMFVDGDTVLDRQWLVRAQAFFTEPTIGGVAGFLSDVDEKGQELPLVGEHGIEVKPLTRLRGIAAYRRAALAEVGCFNPYLRSEEEAELGLRLRKAGWKLMHLPFPMGCHRRALPRVQAMWRAWQLGRVTGVGLAWRYACQHGLGTRFCFENLRATMAFAAACLLLSPALILWEEHYTRYALLFLYPLAVWMAAIALKKRELTGPISYLVTHLTILSGLLSGLFITRLAKPDSYPLNALELNTASEMPLRQPEVESLPPAALPGTLASAPGQ